MLGAQAADSLAIVLQRRLEAIEKALAALRLQYGEFAEVMQVRYLERAALRIENSEYQRLVDEAVISREVFKDLLRDLDVRWQSANQRPPLDLKLSPTELLVRLPFFHGLDAAFLESIVPLLRPRFIVPGETIIRKGEKGREMFFLASGAVEVKLASGPRRLGSGDFFGELALLTQARAFKSQREFVEKEMEFIRRNMAGRMSAQATPVVPLPMKGSRTRSPGSVVMRRQRSTCLLYTSPSPRD